MKALTIKQPWAGLIAGGWKDVENRVWRTGYRGPVLIHASKKLDPAEFLAAEELIRARGIKGVPCFYHGDPIFMQAGGIIGSAEVTGCIDWDLDTCENPNPWRAAIFGFVMANPRRLPFRACRGALGFWDCDYPQALLEAR